MIPTAHPIRAAGGALLALLAVGGASAYVLLDPPRTWDSAPTYLVDQRGMASVTDGDGGLAATVDAVTSNQAWNGAGSGNVINARGGDVSGWRLGDGVPMLNFADPERVCSGNCLAATFIGFYEPRGDGTYRIFDADIVTNNRFAWTSAREPDGCASEYSIEGVQVHETGHGLGLGHTDVAGATMYPSVAACDDGPATIAQDDIDGLNALYSGGGGGCDLGQPGDGCTADAQCCSGKCRGRPGQKACR